MTVPVALDQLPSLTSHAILPSFREEEGAIDLKRVAGYT